MGPASPYLTSSTIDGAHKFVRWAGMAVGVLCLAALAGWLTRATVLASGLPGSPTMKTNTALGLLLLVGATLATLRLGPTVFVRGLAAAGGLIGAATLLQYFFHADFGIDQILFADPSAAPYPGRMAPVTAGALASLGLALLLRGSGNGWQWLHQTLAALPFAGGILGLIGLLYQFHFLTGLGIQLAGMGMTTAVSLMLLSAAVLALDPEVGLLRDILANRSGGRFARMALPIALAFPIAVGWLRILGEQAGYYDTAFGILIMVLSAMTVFSAITVIGARRLNRSEETLLETHRALEQRVQERTRDLETTVARLRAENVLREAAEASRAETEAALRSAIVNAPIGMALVGLDGRFQRVNRALCGIVGYDERALLARTFQEITYPEDLGADLALVASLVNGEIPSYQMEKRYLRSDGEPVWIMLSVSLVRDAAGEPLFFVAQIEDIALRRQAEREVSAGRLFLADVVNSIPIPLTVKDENGRIIIANPAMSAFHGKPADEIVGRTDAEMFAPERARLFRAEDQALLRTGIPLIEEQQFATLTGEPRWVIKRKHRIMLSDGNRCVLTTLLDITARKKAEIALRDSEERFRSLAELSSDWYWEQDEEFRFTLQSGGALVAVGIHSRDAIGKARWDLPYENMGPEDWERHRQRLRSHQPFDNLELVRTMPDGVKRHVLISGQPIFDESGTFRGYRGIGRDVTASRKTERELHSSRNLLVNSLQAIPIPISVKDRDGKVLLANKAVAEFHGRPVDYFLGRTDRELYSPDQAARIEAEDAMVFASDRPLVQEQKFPTLDGRSRWIIKHKHKVALESGGSGLLTALIDITERKEAELAVTQQQRFLETVVNAIPQPVYLKDAEHRWQLVNTAFCQLMGRSREELLGKSDPYVYGQGEVSRRAWAEDDEVLGGADEYLRTEAVHATGDGRKVWLFKSKTRVTLPDGSPAIAGVSTDITKLKETAEHLRRSEELHRLLADNSSDLISLMTPAGIIEYASPAARPMLGLAPEQLAGHVVTDYIHPEDKGQAMQIFQGVVKTQVPAVFTCRLGTTDGAWSWIETSFRAIAESTGSPRTHQVIAVSRDVNERVRVTSALNHFKYVLDNTLDMIFIYDVDTLRFNYVNEGAARALGIPREKLIGMAPWEVRADMREKDYAASIEPFLSGRITSRQVETVHRRADGSLMPVEVTMQLLRRPGETGTFISVARDLTDRKKVEQMKNEFISTVSHELRTPVTSIRGSLGLLAGGVAGKLPKQAKQLVDIASNNSDRLIRLINDILDMEKIESGKMNFALHPTALRPLLATALEANQGYAEKFDVRFELAVGVPDVLALADADRILQVMANLLSNAAKFSPAGGKVEVRAESRGATVRVSVTDHGSGIPAEFHDKVFGKFSQADGSDARKLGGSGLGLSITRAIVEKHGGEIGFVTAPGAGTTFHFDLPLASRKEASDVPTEPARQMSN